MILNSYFREIARRDSCQSNLKQIALAMELYSQDYGGYLPPPERWIDVLVPKYLSHHVLTCPASTRTHGPDYAMNSALKGMKLKDIKNSSEVVMAFESQSGTNMHGGPELLLRRPRHRGGDNIAFAYDHVEWVKRSDAGKLKWKVGKKPLSAAK
jgi:hypothetical protein